MRHLLIVPLVVGTLGCGAAAGPLSRRGTHIEPGYDAQLLPSRTAWLTCLEGRYRSVPANVIVIAGYRNCRIVLTEGTNAFDEGVVPELRLGSAANLEKVDPSMLVKGLVRYDTLHLVVRYVQVDDEGDDAQPDIPVHEQVGCHERGIGFDYDCSHEAVMLVLAHEDIAQVEVYNRHWVRWR